MNIKNQFSSMNQMADQINIQKANLVNSNNHIKDKMQGSKQLSFNDILKAKQNISEDVQKLVFSRHANERLISRNIVLTASQMERLESATSKAKDKGIKESLVIVDDLAFVVNIKNRTVITAVNDNCDKVFTNIDGAIIM